MSLIPAWSGDQFLEIAVITSWALALAFILLQDRRRGRRREQFEKLLVMTVAYVAYLCTLERRRVLKYALIYPRRLA